MTDTNVNKTELQSSVEAELENRRTKLRGRAIDNERKQKRSPAHWAVRILRSLMLVVVGTYVGLLVILISFETTLVYPGSKFPNGNWEPAFSFQEIEFASKDSTKLVGWFLPRIESTLIETHPGIDGNGGERPSNPARLRETILICHGNAENVAQSSAYGGNELRTTLNADVFVFDYRGYGKSEGSPAEAGILEDAEAALQVLCKLTATTPQEITIVGHSLGGGPAVHLAAIHQPKALVLQRTFSSIVDAASANYPMFPVGLLMKNRYESAEKIAGYNGPLFQSHGDADELIPIHLAKKLYANAPTNKKQFFEVAGMAHFDALPPNYWSELKQFFETKVNE